MLKIRYVLVLLGMLLSPPASADTQVSISIGTPHFSIGINVPSYPRFVAVPGYPVYYAPSMQANMFYYDGMYWIYQDDYWYASYWYNGPWWDVGPEFVPVFILRVPVRYYRHPPRYFYGWRQDAPPRWGDHWGHDWEQHRSGWDRWDRRQAPAASPLPDYQRQYSGDRYPRQVEQQYDLHQQNYRYQPREPVVRKHYEEQAVRKAPAQQGKPQQERQGAPAERDSGQQDMQRTPPPVAPRSESPQPRGDDARKPAPDTPQQGRPDAQQRQGVPEERDTRQQDMQRSPPSPQAVPDAPRSQSPQQRGEDARKAAPDTPQHGRPEAQERGQQPQPQDARDQPARGAQERGGKPDDDPTGKKKPGQGREEEPGGWDPHRQ